MAITPPSNQWIDTQNLLVLLARALSSPLTSFSLPEQAALSNRIFSNFYQPSHIKNSFNAKLLTTLKTATIEMDRLIDHYSLQKEPPPPKVLKPTQIANSQQMHLSHKTLQKNIGTEPQNLLRQVRIAIGELSTSNFRELPPNLPLSVLTKLKPLVDSYIQVLVSQKPLPHTPQNPLKNPVQITTPQENKIFPFAPINEEIKPKEHAKKASDQPLVPPIQKEKQTLSDLKFIQTTSTPQNTRPTPPDIKPIIPFPTIYPFPSKLIKKKKRKRYFFKDDEEDKNPKN